MENHKTIFITGAGSGIGAAAARLFHSRGWFVGLYDLNLDSVRKLAQELNGSSRAGHVDVTDRHSVQGAIDDFTAACKGRLDVVLNNAGLFQDKPFMSADADYLELMMRVNMEGIVHVARAAHPWLKQTPDSHLVNMGSASSIYGVPNSAIYSATKFFVRGLTEALRIEWEQDDITVNVVMPSYVATPMTDGIQLSHDHSGQLLTAGQVAEAVWQAANSPGMYWVLPRMSRIQWWLVRKLPLAWVPGFARKVFARGLNE